MVFTLVAVINFKLTWSCLTSIQGTEADLGQLLKKDTKQESAFALDD